VDLAVDFVKELLPSIVQIRASVPRAHPAARILGTERMGSGVIIDRAGLILTVNYVVMGAQTVEVAFVKGRRARGEVVALDFEVGLAVIRVKRQGLPAAPLAAGAVLERGDSVINVAATGTQERRVTGGLVTYLGEFETYWEFLLDRGIVSSAPNPGHGGGALFNVEGRLAGIVYLNLNEVARNSLAIPVEFYREHEGEMLRYGRVVSRPRRAWLGVYAHALDEGVVVAGLVPDGPGERGGLQEGDFIVSLNAQEIESRRDLYLRLWRHEPGEQLTLEIMRDRKLRRLEVTGGDRARFFSQP
jgi:S1-C subfamily serine protease